jgi:hypothetical protein
LASFDVVRRRVETYGEGDRSWILHGLRGVGKTVLLNELQAQVSDKGWILAKVEVRASTSLGTALAQSLHRSMRTATGRHPEAKLRRLLSVFKSFSLTADPSGTVSLGVKVDAARGIGDSGNFAEDLTALFDTMGQTARELGIGVLVLLDELQEASGADLAGLNHAVHQLGQVDEPWPVVVVGAGLPSLPALLAGATSYAERLWDYRAVGLLDEAAAREALVAPARNQHVSWSEDALVAATSTAGGYPYLLQSVGKHVWDNARRTRIDLGDVEIGLEAARVEVDEGLYRSRWERATPAQRELLRALAEIGGDGAAPVAAIARRMGKARTSDLSVARNEVIMKGLVYAPDRGLLAFTIPGMHRFVMRQQ